MWGHTIRVNWAQPEKDVDEETMQHVRVLYVRNLMLDTTEETLHSEFSRLKPGSVERVKKLTDYAFIHFYCREDALAAQQSMDGKLIDGSAIEVTLAKPVRKDSGRRFRHRLGHGGGAAAPYGDSDFLIQSNNDSGISLGSGVMNGVCSAHLLSGSPQLSGPYSVESEHCVFPLLPGSSLVPINLQSLKPSQLSSSVSLLDYHCQRNGWSLPEYYLYTITAATYSTASQGKPLLVYKVVISSTQSSYMSDKVCTVLEDAKELAAHNALWNLGKFIHLVPILILMQTRLQSAHRTLIHYIRYLLCQLIDVHITWLLYTANIS